MKQIVILSALAAILGFGAACKPSGPWVSLNGSKITEKDIEKDNPEAYKRLREEYNSQMREMLEQLAVKRMMELEAKEKGTDAESLSRSLMEKAPAPSEKDIAAFYEQISKSGQAEGQSLAMLHDRIAQHLKEQTGRDLVQAEIGNLKKKYKYGYDFTRVKVETAGYPERGNPTAKVTIVEYSDFECPFCMKVQPTTARLRAKYGDKLHWIFKDFPLSFHPHAMDLHIGAKCVYRLNKDHYWDFFDKIFSQSRTPDMVSREGATKVAASVGTDMSSYNQCLVDPAVVKEIQESQKQGEAVGVSGTPAFFINGRMISGAQPMAAFESIIDEEL